MVPTYSTSTSGCLFRARKAAEDFFFFGRADFLTARVDDDEFFFFFMAMLLQVEESIGDGFVAVGRDDT